MKKAMLLLLQSGLILFWSMGSIALSSDNPDLLRAKKPQAVGANDAIPLTPSVQSYPKAISPNFTPGPGTTIGTTHYDYGSNGSPNHNIVNYGDGTISVGRMASTTSFASGSPDRGTYYTYYNGSTWSSFTRVESARRGWGNIDQFKDYGGIEAIVSHTTTYLGPVLNVHAAKGSGIWTEITPTNFQGTTWPKMATGSSATIHFVAVKNPPDTLFYYRTQDAGSSFDKINIPLFPGRTPDADGYDIAAKGTKVAVALSGTGKDVWLAMSNDNGNLWTETKIYDINESLPFNQSEPQPDGSCAVIIDNNNNVHLVWSNYTAVGDSLNHPILNYGLQNKIMHWSQSTGVTTVAVPLSNAMTFSSYVKLYMPGVDGANVTSADIGVDSSNNLFVVYQGQVGGAVSPDSLPYCHLYAVASTNGGVNWTSPLDITSVTGSDNSFPSLADNIDNNLHIVYFTDPYPGNSAQGNHQDVAVDVKYLKVLASSVLGGTTPTITVVSPNGGENWSAGSIHNIAWNSTNVTFVKLEYTTNFGGSWNVIASNVPAAVAASNAFSSNSSITRMQQKMRILNGENENALATNSYLWTIPNTVSSQCLARVSDASDSALYDISDNYFTISQALPQSPGWSLLIDISKTLYGVKAIDSLNVWACGYARTDGTTAIIRTTNGGLTWFNAKGNIGTTSAVIALEATNANVAWVADDVGSIYYTTDGGTTWIQQISISGSYIDVIKRVDATTLVAVGDPSISAGPFVILRSTNNGQAWYQLSTGVPNSDSLEYAWYNLDVQGSVLRFGTRYGKIIKSTDKGITWFVESQHNDVGDIFGLSFTNPSIGVLCGAGGKLKRTTDGGATWTSPPNIGSAALWNVALLQSNSTGWIVGQQGVISKTLNSGATWSQENSGVTYSLYGSSFLSPNLGWVVGNSSILKYNTGGPSPVITSVVPNSATNGQTLPVTITGQNTSFRVTQGSVTYDASHVWFSQGSSTINASSISVSSATSLTASFTIPSTAPTSLWNVNVEQPLSTGIVTLNNGFTINAGSGVVMSLSDAEVDFIGVRVGQFADITFTIRDSTISSGSLTGSVSLSGTGFTMLSGGGSFTLSPGQTWYVTVRYNAASAGFSRGTLTINNNSANYPATAVIPVRGYGVQLASSPKKILFDRMHGSAFGSSTDTAGHSDLLTLLRAAGHTVVTNQTVFNLTGFNYLLSVVPISPYSSAEVSAIQSFVNGGGGLIMLGERQGGAGATVLQNALLNASGWTTGIRLDSNVVRDTSQMINWLNYWIKLFTFPNSSPLLTGVDTIAAYASASLTVISPAQTLVTTTLFGSNQISEAGLERTMQADGTGLFEVESSTQGITKKFAGLTLSAVDKLGARFATNPQLAKIPVVAVSSIGSGLIVVMGDDNIFGNAANISIGYAACIRYAANRIFALNIFQGGGSLISTPRILSVRDVPNDNGKQVFVRWKVDQPAVSSGIARFGVWRKDSVWTFLKDSVLTVNDTVFQFVAPTIYDSTKVSGMLYSVFRVSAHNVNPAIFTMSQPDSGYSLDNLAPSVPQGVKGSVQGGGTIAFLQWNKVPEKDLRYYAVYRSETAGFTQVDSTTFVGASADTTYRDTTVVYGKKYYYRIVAFDWSGNRSDPSDQFTMTILSVGRYGTEIPKEFSLAQNYPNPFNPATIIRYGVPTRSQVKIEVFNTIGQRVATLLNDERDAGYYEVEWRAAVASGIYIYRIEAVGSDNPNNAFVQVKKMVLVR